MTSCLRGAVAAVVMAVGLAACEKGADVSGGSGLTIGVLLPESQTARYETFDRPFIEKKIKELCRDCRVEYANAHGSVATQYQQVDTMLSKAVDVLILDAVDDKSLRSAVGEADDANVPVVAYDKLVEGPVSAFVSYNGDRIARIQGEGLLKALGDKADGSQIIRVEGPLIWREHPALPLLKEAGVEISQTYQAAAWNAENAYTIMASAIATHGADGVDGVWAANDTLAAGVISALKHAHIKPLPPVTGQDAELGAVQRIVSGEQYMSVYKPYKPEAHAAAEMAVALGRGENVSRIANSSVSSPTNEGIPAVVLDPVALTADNVRETVIKDGMYTVDQICTSRYRSACEQAGLTK